MSFAVSRLGPGIGIAPIRIAPSSAAYHSGTRGSITNTWSPLPTPRSSSARAVSREARARSAADCSATTLAGGVDRQHRERVGVLRRPGVDDVEHGVEPLRHVDAIAGALGVDIRQSRGAIAGGTSKRNGRHSSDPAVVLDPATGLAIRISMQPSSVRLRWRNGRQRQAVVAKLCLSGDVGVYIALPGPSARRTRAGETPSDGADDYGGSWARGGSILTAMQAALLFAVGGGAAAAHKLTVVIAPGPSWRPCLR